MKVQWRQEIVQWAVLIAMFATVAMCWSRVPDRIPTHWNAAGEVDGYGSKAVGLLLVPVISLGLYILMLVLPLLDPGKANYEGFSRVYLIIRTALVIFLGIVFATTTRAAMGCPVDMNRVLSLALGGLFVILGNYLGKVRPNWFIGVRTPWTLSSKLSWSKTHRLAGWLFMVSGLLTVLAGLIWPKAIIFVMLGTILPSSLAMVIYSYVVWRSDPERTFPSGTQPGTSLEE